MRFGFAAVAFIGAVAIATAHADTLSYRVFDGSTVIGSGSSTTGTISGSASDTYFSVGVNASGSPFLNAPRFATSTFTESTHGLASATVLTIEITDQGLTSPVTPVVDTFGTNSLNGGDFVSDTISNYFGPANAAYGMAELLGSATFTGDGSFSSGPTLGAYLSPDGTYSETTIYTLNFGTNGGNGTVSTNAQIAAVAATPEPSSFALLGTGLLGVLGVMRKRFA